METEIILLGHGSRRAEANQGLIEVADKVEALMGRPVTPAFMSHGSPSLPQAVRDKARQGAKKVIVMPLFLFSGMHVTVDIHEEVAEVRGEFPELEIIFSEALGADDMIANLASLRIKEAMGA
ncbi:sirohydrochlorin cobaltochelatase [Acididesulfobacillus acetoxydans]|uniref:CbiX protein n=1 Tax=Acididesulfobacillus acetoxydans TaxID=1561005 RepID=A0A8S0W3Q9_9FIRM|nr:CbiX/SirB N-terminal domain-containing protein [Acididesulfobacillus acetoxydans]CAA7601908.1 sirohydrochlorin cobaltochelatase [Acididesulfobacillus acetoxydans]CEJ08248.1 CbiX protein [Acididesulfobacillus acetoxydans]